MNTNNTHTQLPENLMVYDKEWLDEMIKKYTPTKEVNYNPIMVLMLEEVRKHSYHFTPLAEDAFTKGVDAVLECNEEPNSANMFSVYELKQSYLSQPITLKKKQYGKH